MTTSNSFHAALVDGTLIRGNELRAYTQRHGLCGICGTQKTHTKTGPILNKSWEPVTARDDEGNYVVYRGYCLSPTCYTLSHVQELLGERPLHRSRRSPSQQRARRRRSFHHAGVGSQHEIELNGEVLLKSEDQGCAKDLELGPAILRSLSFAENQSVRADSNRLRSSLTRRGSLNSSIGSRSNLSIGSKDDVVLPELARLGMRQKSMPDMKLTFDEKSCRTTMKGHIDACARETRTSNVVIIEQVEEKEVHGAQKLNAILRRMELNSRASSHPIELKCEMEHMRVLLADEANTRFDEHTTRKIEETVWAGIKVYQDDIDVVKAGLKTVLACITVCSDAAPTLHLALGTVLCVMDGFQKDKIVQEYSLAILCHHCMKISRGFVTLKEDLKKGLIKALIDALIGTEHLTTKVLAAVHAIAVHAPKEVATIVHDLNEHRRAIATKMCTLLEKAPTQELAEQAMLVLKEVTETNSDFSLTQIQTICDVMGQFHSGSLQNSALCVLSMLCSQGNVEYCWITHMTTVQSVFSKVCGTIEEHSTEHDIVRKGILILSKLVDVFGHEGGAELESLVQALTRVTKTIQSSFGEEFSASGFQLLTNSFDWAFRSKEVRYLILKSGMVEEALRAFRKHGETALHIRPAWKCTLNMMKSLARLMADNETTFLQIDEAGSMASAVYETVCNHTLEPSDTTALLQVMVAVMTGIAVGAEDVLSSDAPVIEIPLLVKTAQVALEWPTGEESQRYVELVLEEMKKLYRSVPFEGMFHQLSWSFHEAHGESSVVQLVTHTREEFQFIRTIMEKYSCVAGIQVLACETMSIFLDCYCEDENHQATSRMSASVQLECSAVLETLLDVMITHEESVTVQRPAADLFWTLCHVADPEDLELWAPSLLQRLLDRTEKSPQDGSNSEWRMLSCKILSLLVAQQHGRNDDLLTSPQVIHALWDMMREGNCDEGIPSASMLLSRAFLVSTQDCDHHRLMIECGTAAAAELIHRIDPQQSKGEETVLLKLHSVVEVQVSNIVEGIGRFKQEPTVVQKACETLSRIHLVLANASFWNDHRLPLSTALVNAMSCNRSDPSTNLCILKLIRQLCDKSEKFIELLTVAIPPLISLMSSCVDNAECTLESLHVGRKLVRNDSDFSASRQSPAVRFLVAALRKHRDSEEIVVEALSMLRRIAIDPTLQRQLKECSAESVVIPILCIHFLKPKVLGLAFDVIYNIAVNWKTQVVSAISSDSVLDFVVAALEKYSNDDVLHKSALQLLFSCTCNSTNLDSMQDKSCVIIPLLIHAIENFTGQIKEYAMWTIQKLIME